MLTTRIKDFTSNVLLSIILLLLTYYFLLPIFIFAQPDWGPDIKLVDMPDGSWNPQAAAWGDTIHLVWHQRYAYEETYYKRSTDCGTTWSDNVMLSVEDNIGSVMPDVAVKGDTLIVAWNEYNRAKVAFRISEDGGETFGPVDSVKGPGVGYPSIAMVEDTVYMAIYCFAGNPGIDYTHSEDGGFTWDSLRHIYNDAFQPCRIAVTWPDVHIVFSADDTSYAGTEIFCLASSDGGRTWRPPTIISYRDTVAGQIPFNTSWPGGTAAVWYDYKYSPYVWTGDIFFRRNVDSVDAWDEIDSLTTSHRAVWSDILAERTQLHVVWEDERHDPGNNFEIYYRESTDLGITWLPEVRLTNAPYYSYGPSLACGGGYLHLFWQDRREYGNTGYAPLYYKRKNLISNVLENNQKEISNILSVFPDPCRNSTTITWSLNEFPAVVDIFDVTGRRIFRQNISGKESNKIIWKGKDQQGKEVKTGIYFIQLKTENQTIANKLIFVK